MSKKYNYWFVSLAGLVLLTGCSQAVRNPAPTDSTTTAAAWEFDDSTWRALGEAPACPEPLALALPYTDATATELLYPGQTRGGDYKSHGGFRFDASTQGNINVIAPLDAKLVEGSRYIEAGEVQYYFIFIHPCGLMYRLDHLHTLSPTFQTVAEQLPAAQVDDSRTTKFAEPLAVTAGDLIATTVGFPSSDNISFDFGFYDLRTANGLSAHSAPAFDAYGLCFLDYLPTAQASTLQALPTGSEGGASDYCL